MIEFKNSAFSYAIGENAENLYFKDLRDGKSYLSGEKSVCSYVTLKNGEVSPAASASFDGATLSLTYENGLAAKIEITDGGDYFIFTLKEVSKSALYTFLVWLAGLDNPEPICSASKF